MEKRIFINADKCDGCGICELVCALERSGAWHPALSRIKVKQDPLWRLNLPTVCNHCEEAFCRMACLMNVITKDEETGRTVRDLSRCIGCRACQVSCPFDACTYDFQTDKVVNCDLCGGAKPACVEYCPTGALVWRRIGEEGEDRRRAAAGAALIEETAN